MEPSKYRLFARSTMKAPNTGDVRLASIRRGVQSLRGTRCVPPKHDGDAAADTQRAPSKRPVPWDAPSSRCPAADAARPRSAAVDEVHVADPKATV